MGNVSIKDTYYMKNSGLIHVATSIKLHSPVRETAETTGHDSAVNRHLEGWKLMSPSHN